MRDAERDHVADPELRVRRDVEVGVLLADRRHDVAGVEAKQDRRRATLERMLGFVVGSLSEPGEPPADAVRRWEASRRALLDAGRLSLRVRHLDLLARRRA